MSSTVTESTAASPIIQVTDLSKTFRTLRRKPGLVGAFRNLSSTEYEEIKAVDRVSFEIAPCGRSG